MHLLACNYPVTTTTVSRDGMEIFARIVGPAAAPALLFLQGGPGFPAPREGYAWIEAALAHGYRVVLLDQRGTGNSSCIDRSCPDTLAQPHLLSRLRASDIVADAEALREQLGIVRWDVLGQSFGGFCLVHYLLEHPESLGRALFTGGLPSITRGIDETYRATFTKLRRRHEEFYAEIPWAQAQIREVCAHLAQEEEYLPTGERLSPRRFRMVGIELGREGGFGSLAGLLERPFHPHGRLRTDFLAAVGQRVSFEDGPLYGVIHESIYGGTVPGATAWAAQRVSQQLEGFAPDADPLDQSAPFFLTGEHIFPFQFNEDPALRPFKQVADALAAKEDWDNLYARAGQVGRAHGVKTAAVVYRDDIFVPRELSLETAEQLGINVWETAQMQHDGLRKHGKEVFARLMQLAE